jgi:signal transduction histidine kinase
MARRALARVTPAADAKHVLLQVEVASGLPSCETDANRVEQILLNLLGNAIQHTPEGSTVRLQVTARDAVVAYTVEDEGAGIDESEVERIFDIYVTNAAGEGRGAGLGLPLSRRLARLLGGELRAVPRPHKGGCFILELPEAWNA